MDASTGIYSEVGDAHADIKGYAMAMNNSYESTLKPKVGERRGPEGQKCVIISIVILFACMALLLIIVVAACTGLGVESNGDLENLMRQVNQNYSFTHNLSLQMQLANADFVENFYQQVHQNLTTFQQVLLANANLSDFVENFYQQVHQNIQQVQLANADFIDAFSQQVHQNFSDIGNSLLQVQQSNAFLLGNVTRQLANTNTPDCACANLLSSCAALPSSSPSGYYIVRAANGSGVRVYCDMTRSCGGVTGGWMRIAALDMRDTRQRCPDVLTQRPYAPNLRTCSSPGEAAGCTSPSLIFPASAIPYSKVCGSVIAFQYRAMNAFRDYYDSRGTLTLNDAYVGGVSITHGTPRQHVWTFVAARDELVTHYLSGCECLGRGRPAPPYVGNDYFCDSGSRNHVAATFYGDDPLWDGAGCDSVGNSCCSFNNPPFFYKQLPQPTTDNIEMRICRNARIHSDLAVQKYEFYVQ
jgi:hypothetical protein